MSAVQHTRHDGCTVTLAQGGAWRLEVRNGAGELIEQPMEWLGEYGSAARSVFLRKCSEPVSLDADLVADIRRALGRMRGLKAQERAAIELRITSGNAIMLAASLSALSGRAQGEAAAALGARARAAGVAAIAALPEAVRALIEPTKTTTAT